MRYLHDCDKCVPLGEYKDADLYYCNQKASGPTVIARYSDDPSNYISGLCFANINPYLHEAKIRAIDMGLLR